MIKLIKCKMKFFILSIIFIVFISQQAMSKTIFCVETDVVNVEKCVKQLNEHDVLEFDENKTFETSGIKITEDNIKIIIPNKTKIILSDEAKIKPSFGGTPANQVIYLAGNSKKKIKNIQIELNGTIDGNKNKHKYEDGGVEGISLLWTENVKIYGSGKIINANGDGIDIDASNGLLIENITVQNNGASGIHFGSPRPIRSSYNNLVRNVISIGNGFDLKKSGFDLSWPNEFGVIYHNVIAKDNYQNFNIEAYGGAIYFSESLSTGKVQKKDFFKDASIVIVNEKDKKKKLFKISYAKLLILKLKIKRFLGFKNLPDFVEDIQIKKY